LLDGGAQTDWVGLTHGLDGVWSDLSCKKLRKNECNCYAATVRVQYRNVMMTLMMQYGLPCVTSYHFNAEEPWVEFGQNKFNTYIYIVGWVMWVKFGI